MNVFFMYFNLAIYNFYDYYSRFAFSYENFQHREEEEK